MSDERLFLMEHKGNYAIHHEDATDYYIKNMIATILEEQFKHMCDVYPMYFTISDRRDGDYAISCSVILRFESSHDVNKFKISNMTELENMVEIKDQ